MKAQTISDPEVAGVLALDASQRYTHFIKQVADRQLVWGLKESDGWVSMTDETGTLLLPMWPREQYAVLFAVDRFPAAVASAISLDDLMDTWLPNLSEEGSKVAVFPVLSGQGIVVEISRLREDLEVELERYE
jgi:hypothetical protein